MSVVQQIEDLLNNPNVKQSQKVEQFQQQYNQMLLKGVVLRKGYNLAGINVIGDMTPSVQNLNISTIASAYNRQ